MSGWNGSDRRIRLPENWPQMVKAVKIRDKGRCRWILPKSKKRCPRPGTDVDHVVPGDDHSLKNLQLLCAHHHQVKTTLDNRRAGKARKALKHRPSEKHPGDV
jgi:5-methylcytosine-specific restriction protein A